MNTPINIHDPVNHTLEGFRAFFAAQAESRWIIFSRDDGRGSHCAVGFTCQRASERRYYSPGYQDEDTHTTSVLTALFTPLARRSPWGLDPIGVVTSINNGLHPDYTQLSPRARILAAIDDLIALRDAKVNAELDAIERRPLVSVTPVLVEAV